MDLGKIVRDREDADVRKAGWGAVGLAVITLLQGIATWRALGTDPGVVVVAIGVAQLSLAIGTFRGSRACAVAILVLFLVDRVLVFRAFGWPGVVNVVTLVMLLTLYAGVEGTFAQYARRQSARSTRAAA
jgi:hypothetical protein